MSDTNVDLDGMSLEQLSQLKQQEEGRLQAITQRYAQLRAASARLQGAKTSLSDLKASPDKTDVMVPLTESLYVPAKLVDAQKIMVELGTGFFVEVSQIKNATAILDRKLKMVDANSENIVTVVQATRVNIENVNMAMQGKMLEIRARQEGMQYQSAEAASS
jgi:prefoldin alpha subunit